MLEYYITILIVMITSSIAMDSISYVKLKGLYSSKKFTKYKLFCIITTVILIFVAGLRYHVGADYNNYVATYEVRKITWIDYVLTFDEPGISVLCKLSSMIYDNFATLFFVCSLITIGLYMKNIYKYSTDYSFSVLMFIFCGTWAGSFGAIRQYLAAAILFAGHRYMFERKFWKWFIVVICAFCFHRTAIVMLPVYFIANKKINIRTIFLLIISVIVVRYSYDYIFALMSSYKGTDQSQYEYMQTTVNIFRVLVAAAPILLYYLVYFQNNNVNDSETNFYSIMLFVNAAFMIATSNSAYLARAGIYTETFIVFGFPKLLEHISPQVRREYKFIILICYFLYFAYQIYTSNTLNNFQWVFNHI